MLVVSTEGICKGLSGCHCYQVIVVIIVHCYYDNLISQQPDNNDKIPSTFFPTFIPLK